jgi:hypothetical protein
MNQRANPFANPPVFTVKARKDTPIAKEAIDSIAEEHNFPSREAKKVRAVPKRKPRIYRTGRNRHFGLKATTETVERFYKLADERGVTLGRLLELALEALDRTGTSQSRAATDASGPTP